ncbi:hypothetical protein MCOR25_011137 [Pyricularia grisea]|nr:hypothetical protein MCOR25_011137 [Pyricularia grisea]
MARPTNPETHDKQRKELVRKRGGSLMRKAEQLGKLGETFVLAVVFDPLYGYEHCPHPQGLRRAEHQKSVEASDGSYLQEDDGDSSVEENGNQEDNELLAYSNGTSEIDAPHEVDDDFETLFRQIHFCNEPKIADFQPVRTQTSTVKRRIVGIRLKDGRFIPKGSLDMGNNTLSVHRVD